RPRVVSPSMTPHAAGAFAAPCNEVGPQPRRPDRWACRRFAEGASPAAIGRGGGRAPGGGSAERRQSRGGRRGRCCRREFVPNRACPAVRRFVGSISGPRKCNDNSQRNLEIGVSVSTRRQYLLVVGRAFRPAPVPGPVAKIGRGAGE